MEAFRVMVIDANNSDREKTTEFLEKNSFKVFPVANSKIVESEIKQKNPDILVVDIKLPQEDGISFCRRLREYYKKPIIICTSIDDVIEQIMAYEVGVDDYLIKPCNERLLLTIIKAKLLNYKTEYKASNDSFIGNKRSSLIYKFSDWQLNNSNHVLSSNEGLSIILTTTEYRLLKALVENAESVISRDQLLDLTKGSMVEVCDRSIDIIVSRLRGKIEKNSREPKLIKTIRGSGYMFSSKVSKVSE